MKKKKLTLIYLEWCDACTRATWMTEEEALEWGREAGWVVCEAGWLLEENEEYILIASAYSPKSTSTGEPSFNVIHKIPTTWIRNRKSLMKLDRDE